MRYRTMARAMALIGIITATLLWASPVPPRSLTGPVVKVVDGDTIDVDLDGQRVRVRYIGVNTPETKHPTKGREPCGGEASAANRTLVDGRTVRLELDVQPWDRYQRLLAYVYVGELMVNAELVRQGYAQPPDVRYQSQFLDLQRAAREAGVGCWKAP
jgi:micrococcal nuclease